MFVAFNFYPFVMNKVAYKLLYVGLLF